MKFHLFGEPLGLILSRPDQPLVSADTALVSICGAEGNVGIGLARLGASVAFHSMVGADPYGERILRTLRAEGIDISGVQKITDATTGLLTRTCYEWREPDITYHRSQSAFALRADEIAPVPFQSGDFFFTTGITLALSAAARSTAEVLICAAREQGVVVCLDANDRRKLWSAEEYRRTIIPLLSQIDLLFLSFAEAQTLTLEQTPEAILEKLHQWDASEVIIKNGAEGALHSCPGVAPQHIPAFPLDRIIDPIGAGDAFDAGFLSARAAGCSTRECLERGAALGALVCLTPGDWESLPHPGELARFLARSTEASR